MSIKGTGFAGFCRFGPARILRNAARLRRIGGAARSKPIGGPFPDIADHVKEAVAIGGKRLDMSRR